MTERAAILGAGAWGTALAIHLSKIGAGTVLWARSAATASALQKARENRDYLPDHALPESLAITSDLPRALHDASLVIFVVPAQASRAIFRQAAPHLRHGADLVIDPPFFARLVYEGM